MLLLLVELVLDDVALDELDEVALVEVLAEIEELVAEEETELREEDVVVELVVAVVDVDFDVANTAATPAMTMITMTITMTATLLTAVTGRAFFLRFDLNTLLQLVWSYLGLSRTNLHCVPWPTGTFTKFWDRMA